MVPSSAIVAEINNRRPRPNTLGARARGTGFNSRHLDGVAVRSRPVKRNVQLLIPAEDLRLACNVARRVSGPVEDLRGPGAGPRNQSHDITVVTIITVAHIHVPDVPDPSRRIRQGVNEARGANSNGRHMGSVAPRGWRIEEEEGLGAHVNMVLAPRVNEG